MSTYAAKCGAPEGPRSCRSGGRVQHEVGLPAHQGQDVAQVHPVERRHAVVVFWPYRAGSVEVAQCSDKRPGAESGQDRGTDRGRGGFAPDRSHPAIRPPTPPRDRSPLSTLDRRVRPPAPSPAVLPAEGNASHAGKGGDKTLPAFGRRWIPAGRFVSPIHSGKYTLHYVMSTIRSAVPRLRSALLVRRIALFASRRALPARRLTALGARAALSADCWVPVDEEHADIGGSRPVSGVGQ